MTYSRFAVRLAAAIVVAFGANGCGNDAAASDMPDATEHVRASALTPPQTGVVGEPLTTLLRVRANRGDAPASGVKAVWSVVLGGGSLAAVVAMTDADGIASASWTLGTAVGANRVRVALEGAGDAPVMFDATAVAGPAATLAVAGPSVVAGIAGSTITNGLRALVRDTFGNPVAGVPVHWEVLSGEAAVSAAASVTSIQGLATISVVLTQTGMSTVRASAPVGTPASFTVASLTAPSATFDVEVGNNFFQPTTIAVPVNALVRWTLRGTSGVAHVIVSSAEPSFAGPLDQLGGDGTTFQTVFAAPGTYRYECTLHSGMSGIITVQ